MANQQEITTQPTQDSTTEPGPDSTTAPKQDSRAEPITLTDLVRQTRDILRRLGPGGPLALVASTLPLIGLITLASCFNLIGPWLKSLGPAGVGIYIGGFMICSGVAIFPTHIQAALGGWAFGFAIGAPAACLGVLGGAAIGYVVGLRATGERALQLIAEKPKWKAVYDALLGGRFWRAFFIVLLVRLALSPFALTNLLFATARVHPLAYALGTLIGLAPRTCAVVFLAVGLREVTAAAPHQLELKLISLAATLIAVFVIAWLANRAIARATQLNAA